MKTSLVILKSVARIALSLLLIFIVLVAGLFVAAGTVSDIHIKKYWINAALQKFLGDDIKVQAEDIDLHLIKENFWQKRLTLELLDTCVSYQEPAVHVCFTHFDLSLVINYAHFKPSIVAISPLHLLGAEVTADLDAFKPAKAPAKPSNFSIVDLLRKDIFPHWSFAGSKVDLKSAHIKTGAALYSFKAFLGANTDEIHVILPDVRDLNSDDFRANGSILAFIPHDLSTSPQPSWKLQIGAHLVAVEKSADVDLKADLHAFDDIGYELKTKFHNLSIVREARLQGTYKKDALNGVFSIQLGGYGSQIKQVNFVNCGYLADLDKKTGSLNCGPQSVVLSIKENAAFRHSPELFRLRPTVSLKLTEVSFKKGVKAKADLKIALQHLKILDFNFHASGFFDGSEKKTRYGVKVESGADIDKFKKLVGLLRMTPFAIPAPLNVMKGHLAFGLHGEMDEEGGEFPFAFTPDLRSETQRLLLIVGGKIKLKKEAGGLHTKLELDTSVQDVQLAVPRLDLAALPQLEPDSRFATPTPVPKPLSPLEAKRTRQAQELARAQDRGDRPPGVAPTATPGSFSYKVKVHTESPGAIKLATNLTKSKIPISIELTSSSHRDSVIGAVDIGHTAIELFRRKAEVEDIDLKLRPDGTKEINAKLVIHYLDYVIYVTAQGGTDSPNIHLESDPPLDQADIISVLLYGRTSDELDGDQSQSVANTNSAIADKAIGVASLFLLASTPIESVQYNSQTHAVTAKIGLGHGTSLDVGSGDRLVGVNRRLGKNWILSSYVEKDPVTQENAVNAFIEWVRLF